MKMIWMCLGKPQKWEKRKGVTSNSVDGIKKLSSWFALLRGIILNTKHTQTPKYDQALSMTKLEPRPRPTKDPKTRPKPVSKGPTPTSQNQEEPSRGADRTEREDGRPREEGQAERE
jgi:hypothetical protein